MIKRALDPKTPIVPIMYRKEAYGLTVFSPLQVAPHVTTNEDKRLAQASPPFSVCLLRNTLSPV